MGRFGSADISRGEVMCRFFPFVPRVFSEVQEAGMGTIYIRLDVTGVCLARLKKSFGTQSACILFQYSGFRNGTQSTRLLRHMVSEQHRDMKRLTRK